MKRTDLLDILKKAQPALAAKDLIPSFTCFLFDGKRILAHDDIVAISAPCLLPLKGGVRGNLLIDWLSASRAKEVEVEEGDTGVKLKAGRSILNTPIEPAESFDFSFPDDPVGEVPLGEPFLDALRKAALSMGLDPAHQWRVGVTLVFGKKNTILFSSDNLRASRTEAPRPPKPLDGLSETNLAPKFVELLLALAKKEKPEKLIFGKDWVEARLGSVRLWSKTLAEVDSKRYSAMFESVLTREFTTVKVPDGFGACLDRLLVVLAHSTDKEASAKIDDEGKLRMVAESKAVGEIREVIKLPGHSPVSEHFIPGAVKTALEFAKELAFIPEACVYLKGENFQHLVSLVNVKEEKKPSDE